VVLLAFSALAGGCTVSTGAPPPVAAGWVVIDWTINGGKAPDACAQSNVADIEITVAYTSGASAGTFQQTCSAFATTITLNPGDYRATATLLDPRGKPRSTDLAINPFTIHGADQLTIPIDFPSSSFLGPA
jgi:hypothetical protein